MSSYPVPSPETVQAANDSAARLGARCNACKKEASDLKFCTGCNVIKYCDKDCQKADWKSHKKTCKKTKERIDDMRSGHIKIGAADDSNPDFAAFMERFSQSADNNGMYMDLAGEDTARFFPPRTGSRG